jgi:hypothetical protein
MMTQIAGHQFTISLLAKYDLEIGVSSMAMLPHIWVSEDLQVAGMVT